MAVDTSLGDSPEAVCFDMAGAREIVKAVRRMNNEPRLPTETRPQRAFPRLPPVHLVRKKSDTKVAVNGFLFYEVEVLEFDFEAVPPTIEVVAEELMIDPNEL